MDDYTRDYLIVNKNDRRAAIDKCKEELQNFEYDAIAFCGYSGALIAIAVAHELDKDIICVRKEEPQHGGKYSHSNRRVEGLNPADKKIVIIDDFISSGATIRYIISTIKKISTSCEFVGLILYNSEGYWGKLKEEHPNMRVVTFREEQEGDKID